jgi:hypothetical protein
MFRREESTSCAAMASTPPEVAERGRIVPRAGLYAVLLSARELRPAGTAARHLQSPCLPVWRTSTKSTRFAAAEPGLGCWPRSTRSTFWLAPAAEAGCRSSPSLRIPSRYAGSSTASIVTVEDLHLWDEQAVRSTSHLAEPYSYGNGTSISACSSSCGCR